MLVALSDWEDPARVTQLKGQAQELQELGSPGDEAGCAKGFSEEITKKLHW